MVIKSIYRQILHAMKTYKWREIRTSNGREHENDTFFVVRRYTNYNGIASDIIVFLGIFKYMEEKYPHGIPVVDFQNYENGISETFGATKNSWEDFFEQPNLQGIGVNDISKAKHIILSNGYIDDKLYEIPQSYDYESLCAGGWNELFHKYIRLKPHIEIEYEEQWLRLMNRYKRILGVKARGTDYNARKPMGHNIQPSADEIIEEVDKYLYGGNSFDGMYLATEDREIFDIFQKKYGNIIVNSELPIIDYHGGIITEARDKASKYDISKQYLRELWMLSKCDALISGINSGVIPVLLWNRGNFSKICLFDKGKY